MASNPNDPALMSIAELSGLIRERKLSPVELVRSCLDRTRNIDGRINAYITLLEDEAFKDAEAAQESIAKGRYLGPLHGIPIAIKDLIDTAGIRTTYGSKLMAEHVPTEDASVVRRLKDAGAIIIGKTNLHEFAYGVTNNNLHFGPTRNPWDTERIPGGSSGGSGAAVAASLCTAALGTDTGGSIRIPASLCGIVGLKPTYGRVSRAGVFPLSWSLDHIGPMTKTVEDAAIMLGVLAGHDPKDPTSSHEPVPSYIEGLEGGVRGLRLGVARSALGGFFQGLDSEVEAALEAAIEAIRGQGASVVEVSVPNIEYARSMTNAVLTSEAYSRHREYLKTRRDEYDPDVRRRLEMGAFISAADYLEGQRARGMFADGLREVFAQVDALITPTVPVIAPKIGQESVEVGELRVDVRGTLTRFTSPFNLAGLPAISVPCGFTRDGLPIGLQIVGRPFDEATVLRVAHAFERACDWHRRRPPL